MKDMKHQPVIRRNNARLWAILLIEAKIEVDVYATGEGTPDEKNDEFNGLIIADAVDYQIIYHLYQLVKYFIVLVN